MRRNLVLFVLFGSLLSLTAGPARAKIVVGELNHVPTGMASVFPASEQLVEVSIRDARENPVLLAGALIGPKAERGKGIYLGYAPEQKGAVENYLEKASSDALQVLGLQSGPGGLALEIVIEGLRVDMYRLSGFSPMNCMLYANMRSILRGPEGELAQAEYRLTLYETTNPVGSMKEVSREAVSRLFSHAAWQVTSASLIGHLGLTANGEEIELAATRMGGIENSNEAHHGLFWVGLAGHRSPALDETLLGLFRNHDEQGHRQVAVETLGMLGSEVAKEESRDLLEGAQRSEQWDMEDNEQIWYLLRGLHLLGVGDLEELIPVNEELAMRSKLVELVLFQETGQIPELSPADKEKEDKSIAKGRKKGKIK